MGSGHVPEALPAFCKKTLCRNASVLLKMVMPPDTLANAQSSNVTPSKPVNVKVAPSSAPVWNATP